MTSIFPTLSLLIKMKFIVRFSAGLHTSYDPVHNKLEVSRFIILWNYMCVCAYILKEINKDMIFSGISTRDTWLCTTNVQMYSLRFIH